MHPADDCQSCKLFSNRLVDEIHRSYIEETRLTCREIVSVNTLDLFHKSLSQTTGWRDTDRLIKIKISKQRCVFARRWENRGNRNFHIFTIEFLSQWPVYLIPASCDNPVFKLYSFRASFTVSYRNDGKCLLVDDKTTFIFHLLEHHRAQTFSVHEADRSKFTRNFLTQRAVVRFLII